MAGRKASASAAAPDTKTARPAASPCSTEEPPHLRALNALCHNEMADSVGAPKEQRLLTRWYHRRLRNFVRFASTDFARARDGSDPPPQCVQIAERYRGV